MQDKNAGFHWPKPVVMMFYMKMQINVDCMLNQNGFVLFFKAWLNKIFEKLIACIAV